jgi:flagellar protein FlaG
MEKAITTSLLIIASIVAALALINSVIPAMGRSASALATANSTTADRIRTDIEIIHATGDDSGNVITVWVKNVGTKKINAISSSDIILQTPSAVASVAYDSDCVSSGSECWEYSLEGGAANWTQAVTVKFTLKTAVTTGVYTVTISSPNSASATEDFSV